MNNINKEEAAGIITRILMACRIPSNWAKVLAGAIIGAVVACVLDPVVLRFQDAGPTLRAIPESASRTVNTPSPVMAGH